MEPIFYLFAEAYLKANFLFLKACFGNYILRNFGPEIPMYCAF